MRHIIIHYHLYKNAGSSVYSILENNFSGQVGSIEAANSWDTLRPDDLLKYAIDNPHLKAITSHHARLPVPNFPNFVFHPLIFLRHPIDRIGSVYSYEQRQSYDEANPGENPGFKIAHENDFTGYVRWALSTRSASLRNFQTIHLSSKHGDMRNITATHHDLKVALRRLFRLPFFGITEHFDESIARLGNYLSPDFPNFDVQYVATNVSTERKATIQERLDDIKSTLGKNLYQELLDQNAFDLQLYDQALSLFSKKKSFKIAKAKRSEPRLDKHELENVASSRKNVPWINWRNKLKIWMEYRAIRKSGLFDPAYYLVNNPDVRQAEIDPLLHFMDFGWKEGRNPSPEFDTRYYLQTNPDVKNAGINPLIHYLRYGQKEGRSINP